MKYIIKFIRNLFSKDLPVSHNTHEKQSVRNLDKSWKDPYCQIVETSTGKVLKEYGVTVHRT